MAEKKTENGKSAGGKKKLILISAAGGIVVLLVVIVLTMIIAKDGNDGAAGGGSDVSERLPGQNPVFGRIFALDSFVVNLNDPGGKRYLKIKIELEFLQDGFQEELTQSLPRIRDAILLILSSKTFEDIQGIDGKIALRNELIIRLNEVLQTTKVRNLYFTEFVVQ